MSVIRGKADAIGGKADSEPQAFTDMPNPDRWHGQGRLLHGRSAILAVVPVLEQG